MGGRVAEFGGELGETTACVRVCVRASERRGSWLTQQAAGSVLGGLAQQRGITCHSV